jgi:hypothetical protein
VLITFTNLGSVPHDMHLVRIIDGNFSTYRAAVASNAASVADLAEEVAQSTTVEPGGSSTIGAELTPGTYALVSFLTAPDGKTFAQDGMIRDLTVTAA